MVTPFFPIHATDIEIRRRGKRLLGPLSLTIEAEGITVVLGPNGAGKTTLLRALHGIERLHAGQVRHPVPMAEARDGQAFVFQTPIILRRTVAENLKYPLNLKGVDAETQVKRTTAWAQGIGLGDALNRPANRLSGGEKQKLALARALITQPKLLFLDEPCTNLDGPATRDIERLLQKAAKTGTRIIMTTHDLGQAKRLARQVVFLHQGQIVEQAPASQAFDTPQTPQLRAFLQGDIVE